MQKFTLFFFIVAILFPGENLRADRLEENGFSYLIPAGWKASHFSGMKYQIVRGPVQDGVPSSINVIDDHFNGSLGNYISLSLANMENLESSFKLINKSDFTTAMGLEGVRLRTEARQMGKALHQTYYFFKGAGDRKWLVTCSVATEAAAQIDPLFDQTMATFKISRH